MVCAIPLTPLSTTINYVTSSRILKSGIQPRWRRYTNLSSNSLGCFTRKCVTTRKENFSADLGCQWVSLIYLVLLFRFQQPLWTWSKKREWRWKVNPQRKASTCCIFYFGRLLISYSVWDFCFGWTFCRGMEMLAISKSLGKSEFSLNFLFFLNSCLTETRFDIIKLYARLICKSTDSPRFLKRPK